MSLLHCRNKFLISALLWWKEIEEKATSPKWGYLELKIDSACPFHRIERQNFTSEGDLNGTEAWFWLSPKGGVTSIANFHEWHLFSEPVPFDVPNPPHAGPHVWMYIKGKMNLHPTRLTQPQLDLPGLWKWSPNRSDRSIKAELSLWDRSWLTASMKGFPSVPDLRAHAILWSLFINTFITLTWLYKTLKTHYDLCVNNPILETSWFPSAHYVTALALLSLSSGQVSIGVGQFLHQGMDWFLLHH